MTYEMLNFTEYSYIALAVIVGLVSTFFLYLFFPNNTVATVAVFWIAATVALLVYTENVAKPEARGKAEANIAKKYDVSAVLWEAKETTASPLGQKGGEIVVAVKDGTQYIFQYEVNKETSEPTLKNMPIAGGNTPEKATTAEALLR